MSKRLKRLRNENRVFNRILNRDSQKVTPQFKNVEEIKKAGSR